MAFGGPNSEKEVEPFIHRVLGREVPARRVLEAKRRYRLIGGCSPLLEITRRQARGLQDALNARDNRFRVYVGMRHWHPFIDETFDGIRGDGIRRVVALSLSPFESKMSTEPYVLALQRAMTFAKGELEVSVVKGWHTHPLFLRALAEKVQEGFLQFPRRVRSRVTVIFSAHSLPKRALVEDPYVEQIEAAIRGVIGLTGSFPWRLAFQSRGAKGGEWLDPEVSTVLRELMEEGHLEVLMAPVGFVSDNVETLYDIDILYRQQAGSMGLDFRRSPCLNDSGTFIEALSHIVREHLGDPKRSAHGEVEK